MIETKNLSLELPMHTLQESQSAWELYCRRGVILPGFADEIAARKAVQRRWSVDDQPLR